MLILWKISSLNACWLSTDNLPLEACGREKQFWFIYRFLYRRQQPQLKSASYYGIEHNLLTQHCAQASKMSIKVRLPCMKLIDFGWENNLCLKYIEIQIKIYARIAFVWFYFPTYTSYFDYFFSGLQFLKVVKFWFSIGTLHEHILNTGTNWRGKLHCSSTLHLKGSLPKS